MFSQFAIDQPEEFLTDRGAQDRNNAVLLVKSAMGGGQIPLMRFLRLKPTCWRAREQCASDGFQSPSLSQQSWLCGPFDRDAFSAATSS